MTDLRTLETWAKEESARLNHYYIGVEHLFLALLRLPQLQTALRQLRLPSEVLQYHLVQYFGQSLDRHYWEGFRYTPRCTRLLEQLGPEASAEALFAALIEEGDSIPVRMLHRFGINLELLYQMFTQPAEDEPPPEIRSELPLARAEINILEQLFSDDHAVEVIAELPGAYNAARLYTAIPYALGGQREASIVHIDESYEILEEKRRYDAIQRAQIPLTTRIERQPVIATTLPLAGLAYHFPPQPWRDLYTTILDHGTASASSLLEQLLGEVMVQWWQHPMAEQYPFLVWQEYDALLPPLLTVEHQHEGLAGALALSPLAFWQQALPIAPGAKVLLHDFTVRQISYQRQSFTLVAGSGDEWMNTASAVNVVSVDWDYLDSLYIGQSLREVNGHVLNLREETLIQQLHYLSPVHDLLSTSIESPLGTLPNPIRALPALLQQQLNGQFAYIHGSLDLGNVLVSPPAELALLDFSTSRFGHVGMDLAALEVSMLYRLFAPFLEDSWESVWALLEGTDPGSFDRAALFAHISWGELLHLNRQYMQHYLHSPQECLIPVVLHCLRLLQHTGLPGAARRLAFAWAALILRSLPPAQ